MAYRYGDRNQTTLFPQSIEEYILEKDPVRAYDAFVEALDFNDLGIVLDTKQVGNSAYYPKAMLKLLVYGYSYGERSSRKLERAVHHNISFIWLMGGLKPDHKTIARFRQENKARLKKVLKQCARLCLKLGLIEGNTLFVDGSKIRANASIKNAWTKEKCERYVKHLDERIEEILGECEKIDEAEKDHPSYVALKEEIKDKESLKEEVTKIIEELKEEKKKSLNTTDAECTRIKSLEGSHAGYNSQLVVDEKHGLIVSGDVVSENNDLYQFAKQIKQANETLGKKCQVACADSGYATTDELKKIDDQGIKVIVPSQRQARGREPREFEKENFKYDSAKDNYVCPEGNILTYRYTNKEGTKEYRILKSSLCKACRHYGLCTKSPQGRRINRLKNEATREKLEAQYKQPKSQAIYKLRQERSELPFGHIKRNLKVSAFLLRGLDGVKTELSLLGSCFNIARMITILGVSGLIQRLTS